MSEKEREWLFKKYTTFPSAHRRRSASGRRDMTSFNLEREIKRIERREEEHHRKELLRARQGDPYSFYSFSFKCRLSLGKIGYITGGKENAKFVPWEKDPYYLQKGIYCDKWIFPVIWQNLLIDKAERLKKLGFSLNKNARFEVKGLKTRRVESWFINKNRGPLTIGPETKATKKFWARELGGKKPWFGIEVKIFTILEGKRVEISIEEAEAEEEELMPIKREVVVTKVFPQSPADKIGIKKGDEIRHLNGAEINCISALKRELWDIAKTRRSGATPATSKIRRGKKNIEISPKLYVRLRYKENIPPGSY